MNLPNELLVKTFQYLPPDELLVCCQEPEWKEIFSSSYFWHEKFSGENLPILQEGYDFNSWLYIYGYCVIAADFATQLLAKREKKKDYLAQFPLSAIKDPKLLFFPGVDKDKVTSLLVRSWRARLETTYNKARERLSALERRAENEGEREEVEDFLKSLAQGYEFTRPWMAKGYCLISGQPLEIVLFFIEGEQSEEYRIKVTSDELWYLLYHLVFFGTFIEEIFT